MDTKKAVEFHDIKVHVRFKLFALWCSVMFFYIYGDYFEFYQPGKLRDMLSGLTLFGPISQSVLLGMSTIMIVPSLMPFLSLALPAGVSRWANIVFGVMYTLIMLLAIWGSWYYYMIYGIIEIALTLSIVWYAWTWPKQANADAT